MPTTHNEGVAVGIVKIISTLMKENNISPEDVVFIAHGTTQATNALLEGDVAGVGIIGTGTGFDARSAKNETKVQDIELAPSKYLRCHHVFIDSKELDAGTINTAIEELISKGSEVIVASGAYSVDDPKDELKIMKQIEDKGVYCTGGHEISQLYGLKMRTRTAVVNGSLIPKMMETANMTEQAVKEMNIQSDLMIMRCDGGVMSINEVRKRPILTMLSGLAAGVAGALMYEKVSDGIFFEVGGTSVDISVIKNGKVMIKYAQVGGHKTYLTLVGGGGSGAVVVNALAKAMGLKWKLAKNAPYISTIGVALAMVREQLERTVVNPTEEDIKKIRMDVIEKIVQSGAKEETVDVSIEIDAQKNILRAIASGATELRQKDLNTRELTKEQLLEISAEALGALREEVSLVAAAGRWNVFHSITKKKLFGLFPIKKQSLCVVDREGVIRFKKEKGVFIVFIKGRRNPIFNNFLDEHTVYSDANATIPKVFVFYREKMLDLTGMQTAEQLYSILDVETEALEDDEEIIAVAYK